MDSKDNNLIEVKTSFFEKIVNNVKSLLFGIFSKKEIQEEISDNYTENVTGNSSNVEKILNDIKVEKIDTSNDIKTYDNTENTKKEMSLQEKLENLLKENEELGITLNNKLEELKEIRIKELKITLEIYKIEETYLRKVIGNYNS